MINNSLGECLKDVCISRPDEDIINTYNNKNHDPYFKKTLVLKNLISKLLTDKNFKIKSYTGHNSLYKDSIVWIGIKDKRERHPNSFQLGVYIVYLFSLDKKTIYLTLNQGVSRNIYIEENKKKVRFLSSIPEGFLFSSNIDLNSDNQLAKSYAEATIYWKMYTADNMPQDSTLEKDLKNLIGAYDEYETSILNSLKESINCHQNHIN